MPTPVFLPGARFSYTEPLMVILRPLHARGKERSTVCHFWLNWNIVRRSLWNHDFSVFHRLRHFHSASLSVYVSSPPGHMAIHRGIIYVPICHIDTCEILNQYILYVRSCSTFYFFTLVITSQVMCRGKPKYVHIFLYQRTAYTLPNTFGS